ncbi:hypothetical protein ACFQ3W_11900 [Paenibacillus puldeungensis]|uniref:Uncharacterized protein n=2 Tax=Paenibacillus puldeungensis TaxID=696536 RepID=A0ABW3RXQ4_9BACL
MKKIGLLIFALLFTLMFAACSNDGSNTSANSGNEASGNGRSQHASEHSSKPQHGLGTFVGMVDNHSIEIEMNGQPTVFQIDEKLASEVKNIKQGASVTYVYYEQVTQGSDPIKQLVLNKITVSAGDSGKTVKGEGSEDGLPPAKKLAVELEGVKEERNAKLVKGHGYGLYLFDGFSFDAATNQLQMDYDPKYHVEIVKLPSDYSVEEFSKEAKSELSKTGKVEERKGDEIDKTMRDASLFLIASSDTLTQEYILKEIDGQAYAFKVNMPHGEASEGFGPLAFASLNSIVNLSNLKDHS